jgi:hypothetical protein
MAFGKSFKSNPASKGHDIEQRLFYDRGADFQRMTQAVPFKPGEPPTAITWWLQSIDKRQLLCTGEPVKNPLDRQIAAPINADRAFAPGDKDGSLIECRSYNSETFRGQMLKVCAPNFIPGLQCMSWWEVPDPAKPDEGVATLCTGLVAVRGEEVNQVKGDGLEGETKDRLRMIAGTEGVKDVTKHMPEGEIIQKIRAKRAEKGEKA